VLHSNGDGTLQLTRTFPAVGGTGMGVVSADFDRDGYPDLAWGVSTRSGPFANVPIAMNDGGGDFSSAPRLNLGGDWVNQLQVADFNLDGLPDLVMTETGGFIPSLGRIYLGQPNASFVQSQAVGLYAWGLAAGDFNSDGRPDLAAFDPCPEDGGCIDIISNLDAGYALTQRYLVSDPDTYGSEIHAVDLDGNGALDLIVVFDNGTLGVLLGGTTAGHPDGTFGPETIVPLPFASYGLAIADFDGDGSPDLALPGRLNQGLDMLVGAHDGGFALRNYPIPLSYDSFGSVAADFDGDGRPDLAIAGVDGPALDAGGTITILLNRL
jgi:hypothetical protein